MLSKSTTCVCMSDRSDSENNDSSDHEVPKRPSKFLSDGKDEDEHAAVVKMMTAVITNIKDDLESEEGVECQWKTTGNNEKRFHITYTPDEPDEPAEAVESDAGSDDSGAEAKPKKRKRRASHKQAKLMSGFTVNVCVKVDGRSSNRKCRHFRRGQWMVFCEVSRVHKCSHIVPQEDIKSVMDQAETRRVLHSQAKASGGRMRQSVVCNPILLVLRADERYTFPAQLFGGNVKGHPHMTVKFPVDRPNALKAFLTRVVQTSLTAEPLLDDETATKDDVGDFVMSSDDEGSDRDSSSSEDSDEDGDEDSDEEGSFNGE